MTARQTLSQAVDAVDRRSEDAVEVIRKEGRRVLKRFFSRSINRFPAITFIIVELDGRVEPVNRSAGSTAQ
jgi:hypothetical protein